MYLERILPVTVATPMAIALKDALTQQSPFGMQHQAGIPLSKTQPVLIFRGMNSNRVAVHSQDHFRLEYTKKLSIGAFIMHFKMRMDIFSKKCTNLSTDFKTALYLHSIQEVHTRTFTAFQSGIQRIFNSFSEVSACIVRN